jgi:hypothetical protein
MATRARRARIRGRARRSRAVTLATVRRLALALPDVEEGTSYGTPAFRVRGKLFARLHEDGESLVVRIAFQEREILMDADPKTFHITAHYLSYPMMLVRLATVRPGELRTLLADSWRQVAPARLAAAVARGR